MEDYIDNIVIKLKRQYSKDELVAKMINEERNLKFEMGVIRSERDELQYKLDSILKMDNNSKSVFCQEEYVRNMKNEIKALKEKCRSLKIENSRLLEKVVMKNLNK